ncbi:MULTISPECIES: DEAD/DEAH box helicase [Synechococcaceae]|uniref:SNF2-related protein n=1 Tax=Synechococcaceae TaxID=1890426 RepID=UPI000A6A2F78|nr:MULTISPECIES: DEAD/DEAH box helicase [Synechococcaceae]MCT4364832.1 DEAD/DEAH box helicase [Candidatus Regnicoccus frigidus MAG-AL1]MCT4368515.1 DEAD/DEAH box helicase [Candidatus Regnicoccus frigidus MAG-AL2]TWB93769.1 helicase-like protein [Synechococcus sp. Ace-Pa]
MIEVISPFDPVTQAQLRAVRPRGEWRARRHCWEFPLEASLALRQLLGRQFRIDAELSEWMDWLEQPLPPLPAHRELVAAADLERCLPDGRRLYAHQRLAVRWLLARRGALLAHPMGLGKTLTALAAARAMARLADCRIAVIAPGGLHAHWRQEAIALGLQLELISWGRLPRCLPPAGTVLLVDEAHYAQNLGAARTQALLRLARHPRLRAIWLLTGTPMKNGRPAQLFPLLMAIGHPLGLNQLAFEQRYCQGHWRQIGERRQWQASGAERLEELQALTRPLLLHRRKQDCLELPPKRRRFQAVDLSTTEGRGFQHLLQAKVNDYRRRAARGEVRPGAESLAMLTALRQIGAQYKLPAARELVAELLQRQEAVVVFTAFVAAAELLQQHLGGALITGRLKPAERQGEVNRFQAGETSLLVATFGSGGIGFNLHRAAHVILIERPWTPGDAEQAEDRCHRIGMAGPLTSHWLQLGVADQLVDGLITSKAERIALLLEGRQTSLRRRALPAMVRELLEGW